MSISWKEDMLSAAKKISILVFVVIFGLSGVGYLFFSRNTIPNYFDERINVSTEIVKSFCRNDRSKYIKMFGMYQEALKHGIEPSSLMVKEYIEKNKIFQQNGEFDKETFKKFLKKNKITESEVKIFFKQKLGAKILKNTMIDYPESFDKFLPENLEDITVNYEKFIIILPSEDKHIEKYLKNDSYWKDFVKEMVRKNNKTFFVEEKRSGFIVKINKSSLDNPAIIEKFSDINKKMLKHFSSFQYVNEGRTLEFIEKSKEIISEIIFSKKDDYNISIEFIHDQEYGKDSAYLFDNTKNFDQNTEEYLLSFVTDVIPKHPKEDISGEYYKDLFKKTIIQQEEMLLGNKLLEMINNKEITTEEIKEQYKHFEYSSFSLFLSKEILNNNKENFKIFSTRKGKSILLKDNDDKYVLIHIKDINFSKNKKSEMEIKKLKKYFSTKTFLKQIINYWIRHAEYQKF